MLPLPPTAANSAPGPAPLILLYGTPLSFYIDGIIQTSHPTLTAFLYAGWSLHSYD